MLSILNLKYLLVASKVLNEVRKCCTRETYEFHRFVSPTRKGRLGGYTLSTRRGQGFQASDGGAISKRCYSILRGVFHHVFREHCRVYGKECNRSNAQRVLEQCLSKGVLQNSCTDVVTPEIKDRAIVCRAISDELRRRERMARGMLFNSLGYRCLRSRPVAHSEEEKAAKAVEVATAKSKQLRMGATIDIDFSHWRLSRVLKPCNKSTGTAVSEPVVDFPAENLALLP